jgi:hypothetical protein
MTKGKRRDFWITFPAIIILLTGGCFSRLATAQNPELQQKIAELKQAAATNRQELAQYTWVEQVTTLLKGEQKKQERFQVRLGPDGKPQKTPMDASAPAASESGGRHGRLKEHVVEKKKEEYKEYADQIRDLIQQYVPPDKDLLQKAAQQGNIMMGPEGTPGQSRLVINNYIKQGDKMTLVIDKAQKNLASVSINSYLNDPKDAVNVSVQFAKIPGGPNHVSTETINGVSKQLTINVQNSNYQKL